MSVFDDGEDLQSWGWTDLSSYSSASLDSEKAQHIDWFMQTGIMSRRSLRLDNGLLDRTLPHNSASFSVGGAEWRSSRSLKPRRSQQLSVSCSESLLHTSRKQNVHSLHNSSLHSAASDASLISSLLDESSIQETTLVDTLWGLDQDVDLKESTVLSEQRTSIEDRTLIGSDRHCPKHDLHTLGRVYCKDCEEKSNRKEYMLCSPSAPEEPEDPETSIIYSRDRIRKGHIGVLVSVWDRTAAGVVSLLALLHHHMMLHKQADLTGVLVSVWDRTAAGVVSLLALLHHHMMLHKQADLTDVLQLFLDWSLLYVRRAAACCLSVLTLTWQVCRGLALKLSQTDEAVHRVRSNPCRVMSLRESSANQDEGHPDGSLCDDCKEKQRSEVGAVSPASSSSSSVASRLRGLVWSAAVFTASSLLQRTVRAASALWPLTKSVFSASVSAGCSAGKSAADVYSWFSRQWRHMNTSLPMNRFLPLLVLLLPLLLFSLCWFAPATLHSFLPAVKLTDWSSILSSTHSSRYSQKPPAEGAMGQRMEDQRMADQRMADQRMADQRMEEPVHGLPPAESGLAAAEESERLVRLERSLTALWERVDAGGRRAEQRHKEVLRLYADLQEKTASRQYGGGEDKRWLSELMETQLQPIRTRVEEERRSREQTRQEDLLQQQSESTRLYELERKLESLASRTQEFQQKQEASSDSPSSSPPAHSVGVDQLSHDALLAEVARLEAALEDVKRDVEGLSACKGGCRELDRVQVTLSAQVSSQVREEVRTLLYGNGLALRGGASADLPDSLLQWLSQRYVSGVDLQGALASLERSILQNISLQLEERHSTDELSESVVDAAGAAGAVVTEEDVNAIVTNALRLFSHDRTGLADYALESGGGSILSTRCSQTYETKAALLSLFGIPLWYFSQSPRVVIQPDVHPGNCWAFKGCTGFLVIRLSMRIVPTAFSLEHIPKVLAPSGTLRSAPRDFSVYGLDDEGQERGKLLGTYMYDDDGESLQTYPVSEENEEAFQIIEVHVLSNWGHEEYTCLYRFRVHGAPDV